MPLVTPNDHSEELPRASGHIWCCICSFRGLAWAVPIIFLLLWCYHRQGHSLVVIVATLRNGEMLKAGFHELDNFQKSVHIKKKKKGTCNFIFKVCTILYTWELTH